MQKILYLHGLESKQGGEKVDFLTDQACVHAPIIDYRSEELCNTLYSRILNFEPDLIIGSSMGGYVAHEFAKAFNLPTILYNPALHSRPFEPQINIEEIQNNVEYTKNHLIILGKHDPIINPEITKNMLQYKKEQYNIVEVDTGHRIPIDLFINIYKKYVNG